jgi:hypothetical protein
MMQAKEDGADRVRVLHIAPRANQALHKVTSPKLRRLGDDAFEVFRSVLVQPGDFVSRATDDVFAKFVMTEHDTLFAGEWSEYLRERYGSLLARS